MTANQKILKHLKDNGIKQTFLASKIKMDDATLSRKLNGQIVLTVEDMELICGVLNCTPNDFMEPVKHGVDSNETVS